MRGISNHASLRLRFMCGLRVDGLAFFIQPYCLLRIMHSVKWMASAFMNVRTEKAKNVSTEKVAKAQLNS